MLLIQGNFNSSYSEFCEVMYFVQMWLSPYAAPVLT